MPKLHFFLIFLPAFNGLIFGSGLTPIAAGASKFLGNITAARSTGIPADFEGYWNQITPENSGKWGNVERVRDSMSWASLDISYSYSREKGFLFKQHTFVWGNQKPSWIDGLPAEEQRDEVEEWIKSFGERYPLTDMIDVVNEPINAPPSFRDALGGCGETGWDWVVWSFEKARQYCPSAKLLINEYNVEDNAETAAAYLQIINILKEKNLIDGIGVQAHCFNIQGVPVQTIKNNLDLLASSGLPIYISELDIAGDDSIQLRDYQALFPLFWEHPAVYGVTLWGWIYNRTWIENTHLLNEDGSERPALRWLREYVASNPLKAKKYLTYGNNRDVPTYKTLSPFCRRYGDDEPPKASLPRFFDLQGRIGNNIFASKVLVGRRRGFSGRTKGIIYIVK